MATETADLVDRARETLREAPGLAVLKRVALSDPSADDAFARLTRLAATFLQAPVALASLVDGDRLVFKGRMGMPEPWASLSEAPLARSFCEHVVKSGEPFVVEDARRAEPLRSYAATRELGLVAYAGIPLVAPCGHVLGTFCVIDHRPRAWTAAQIQALLDLGASVMTEIELRAASLDVARFAAEAERQSHEKLAVLEGIAGAFIALDREWRCTYVNRQAEHFLERVAGRTRIDLVGVDIRQALPAAMATGIGAAIARALTEQCRASFGAYCPPLRRWCGGYAYPARNGVSVYFREVDAAGTPPAYAVRDDDLVGLLPAHDEGAQAALAALYDRYAGAVYGLARRMVGDAGVAEDLLQETFWRLWQRADQYQPGRVRFATWLLRIATNLGTSELRRARCRPFDSFTGSRVGRPAPLRPTGGADGPPPDEPVDLTADVPEEVWLADQRRRVRAALGGLPPEQRQAVELAYFEGLTHAQIAATQRAPLSTVKTRLALGLRKLSVLLAHEGLVPAAAGVDPGHN